MIFTVEPSEDKQRADHVLANRFPDISRSFLQSLCKTDQVLVNQQPQKSGYKVSRGDTVEVLYDMSAIGTVPHIELPIIYEDDDLLVVDKPSGVLSHALSQFKQEPSVASFLRQRTKTIQSPADTRYGMVHRLDRVTSGVMICAKNQPALHHMQRQFADRSAQKQYVAVTSAIPKHATAVIDVPIERNPKAPATFRPGANGKTAQTAYTVNEQSAKRALLGLTPKTGRTHQLRVHLAYINCPIVGDFLYGGEKADRLYLHAESVRVTLPSGEEKQFSAPVPKSFHARLQS